MTLRGKRNKCFLSFVQPLIILLWLGLMIITSCKKESRWIAAEQAVDHQNSVLTLKFPQEYVNTSTSAPPLILRLYFPPKNAKPAIRKIRLEVNGSIIFNENVVAMPLHPHVYSFDPIRLKSGTYKLRVLDLTTNEEKEIEFKTPQTKQIVIELNPLRVETSQYSMVPV